MGTGTGAGGRDLRARLGNEPYRSDLLPADVTPLAFTNGVFTTPFENYEDGWGNTPYNQDLGSITAADFGGAGGVESYEDGWSNAPLYDDVPDLSAPATEDYESGWPINDGPITDLLPIDVTTAEFTIGSSFASSTVEVEDYESVNFDQLIELADAATNFMTVTAHGFVVGEKVSIVNVDGFPPGGLFTETVYFVKSASPNAFTLALSAAGPILDITDGGSGTNYVRADPTGFWTGEELRF